MYKNVYEHPVPSKVTITCVENRRQLVGFRNPSLCQVSPFLQSQRVRIGSATSGSRNRENPNSRSASKPNGICRYSENPPEMASVADPSEVRLCRSNDFYVKSLIINSTA